MGAAFSGVCSGCTPGAGRAPTIAKSSYFVRMPRRSRPHAKPSPMASHRGALEVDFHLISEVSRYN